MNAYLNLLRQILETGSRKPNRTDVDALSIFGRRLVFDLQDGFPLATTKKVAFRLIVGELLWFLSGGDNIADLHRNGVRIWDEWADENGDLGPIYGVQWRSWPGRRGDVDQIAGLIDGLRRDPTSRRHIVSAWNVADLPDMRLPPCHCLFQCDVDDGALSMQVYQRSADVFLGLPFNIASYALLVAMIAQTVGLRPGRLIHILGDVHLYVNHIDQARLQLSREPHPLPRLRLNPQRRDIDAFAMDDIALEGYRHHPPIAAPIAV